MAYVDFIVTAATAAAAVLGAIIIRRAFVAWSPRLTGEAAPLVVVQAAAVANEGEWGGISKDSRAYRRKHDLNDLAGSGHPGDASATLPILVHFLHWGDNLDCARLLAVGLLRMMGSLNDVEFV